MKPRWVVALGVLVIAATIAWSRMEPEPLPVAAAEPATPLRRAEPQVPSPAERSALDSRRLMALLADPVTPEDAGTVRPVPRVGPIDVEIEIVEGNGHASGLTLGLRQRRGGGSADVTTNVMGFATVRLDPGEWAVTNADVLPRSITVAAGTQRFSLRREGRREFRTGGIVLWPEGAPAVQAQILDVSAMSANEKFWEHGSIVATTDFQGRFRTTTTHALGLMATHQGLQSMPQLVSPGVEDAVFHLYAPAWVRTSIVGAKCQAAFVQFEYREGLHEFPLIDADFEHPIPPGLVKFRARCLDVHQLMYGYVEVPLKAGEHARVTFEMEPDEGLRVQTWDVTRNRPVGSLTLTAGRSFGADAGVSNARAITNNRGEASLTPDVLTSFAPVMAIEATGALTGVTTARLGDKPVRLPVFPRHWDAERRAAFLAQLDAGR